MKKPEIVSIMITFTVGFFAGAYLYVAHFTQMSQPNDVETQEQLEEFTVTSQSYGGCRQSCPAWQVQHDGQYRYQYTPEFGGTPEIVSGTLPLQLQRQLERALTADSLSEQTTVVNSSSCRSFVDGIDIRYTVTLNGTEYRLDSCRTDVDDSSDAWRALSAVWDYLNTVR